jgi:DNA-binding NarL/FixJ family response regulator
MKQVIVAIARGQPIKAIGPDLGISPKTVEYHWAQAKRRLGFQSPVDAVKYALKTGLIKL